MSTIKLNGSSSGNAQVTVAAAAGTPTITLPTASIDFSTAGTDGQFLKTNGSGTLSFADAGGVSSDSDNNTLGGTNAGTNLTSGQGIQNTLYGYNAGNDITTGDHNLCVGMGCGEEIDTGSDNIAIGYYALASVTSEGNNVAIGYKALQDATADNNTAIGMGAMMDATTGENNVAIGINALKVNTTGEDNIGIGYEAGVALTEAGSCILIGHDAGKAITTNGHNVCIGHDAGAGLSSGVENVFIGSNAGKVCTSSENTSVGRSSGLQLTSGAYNVFLGEKAGTNLSPSGSVTTGNGVLCLGDTGISDFYCSDTSISSSDVRDKTDIEEFKHGLDWINKLKPITYRWDKRIWYMDPNDFTTPQDKGPTPDGSKKRPRLHLGFRAQDVLEVEKSFGYASKKDDMLTVNLNEDDTAYGMKYERLVPILVNAIQELSAKVAALEAG